ncbi:MAG: HD domain-containing protein [Anaerolineae bacterium]|nr:HD domain-containing protein [Anaerolineae bacterium]
MPLNNNPLLEEALARINANLEVVTLWRVINVNAIDRLGMSDHGATHFQIVANIGLRLTRLLARHEVEMSITRNFGLSAHHAELVVLLASLFHDLGMSIHRQDHESYSLILANTLLRELLDFLPIDERTIVISETLHAIIGHRSGGMPYTVEAGIVRVADALDMSKGRSRIPYEAGQINIHSISAAAIENVQIMAGEDKPIQINIVMNNSAGLFQVDDLLHSKLRGSGIERYIAVRAYVEGETEKSLLKEVIF